MAAIESPFGLNADSFDAHRFNALNASDALNSWIKENSDNG
jgi:hypothetical protein